VNIILHAIPHGIASPSQSKRLRHYKHTFVSAFTPFLFLIPAIFPALALGFEPNTVQPDAAFAADSPRYQLVPLVWSNTPSDKPPKFYYPNPMRPYMRRLNENYHIGEMTADARSDLERVKIVCNWVSYQWKHHGDCPKQKNDPIAILEAARSGAEFSCYEYAMVVAACLNAIGIKSRIVVLLPHDVERRPDGNYHVVAEAYLNNRKKWVMVDAQWNAVPTLNRYPLSIAELQNAIAKGLWAIDFGDIREESPGIYQREMGPYLHYLYTPLDNRVIGATSPANVAGGVMLIPMGDKPPRRFAMAPIGKFIVTNAVADFYGTAQP